MKTKSTLNSFQQKSEVKKLTPKQKMSVLGGMCVYEAMGWISSDNQGSKEDNELLQPMAFFKC